MVAASLVAVVVDGFVFIVDRATGEILNYPGDPVAPVGPSLPRDGS